MTMGELATWFKETDLKDLDIDLSVNLLDNWQPRRLMHECNLPWVPPSPNIPTSEIALLYVGMCLFESTNLNEGRGTEVPFARVGAPWLDTDSILKLIRSRDAIGCTLEAITYTPRSISGKASNPRYLDELCQGIQIHVTDPGSLRPFTLAVALLIAIRRRHPSLFSWSGSPGIDILAGGPDLRERIERGQSARRIVSHYRREHAAFNALRPRLYDEEGITTQPQADR